MSFKSVLAGPSRAAATIPKTQLLASKRQISIPHPYLVLPPGIKGGTKFQIKTSTRIPDILTVFACVRAAEKALGSSVINIDVDRDTELLRPISFIHITTLRPVEFTKPILLSITPPKPTSSDIYGGPSLEDFRSVFSSTPKEAADGEGFSMRIEAFEGHPFRQTPQRTTKNWKTLRIISQQSERVLNALEELGGDWAAIADKWAHLRPDDPANRGKEAAALKDAPYPRERVSQGREGAGSKAGQSDEELDPLGEKVISERNHKDRREAKHRKHEEEVSEPDDLHEDDKVFERKRDKSDRVREARHQQRLEREAERQAARGGDATSDWKFAIGNGQTEAQLGELKLSPETTTESPLTSSEERFSLSRHVTPKSAPVTTDVPAIPEEQSEAAKKKAEAARAAALRKEAREKELEEKRQEKFRKAVAQAKRDAEARALTQRRAEASSIAEQDVPNPRGVNVDDDLARDAEEAMDAQVKEEKRDRPERKPKAAKKDKDDEDTGFFARLLGKRG